MGVAQLGVKVELEVIVERKLLVSEFNVLVLALLNDSTSVYRLYNSINTILEILNKHGLALLKGHLNGPHHLIVRQTGDL